MEKGKKEDRIMHQGQIKMKKTKQIYSDIREDGVKNKFLIDSNKWKQISEHFTQYLSLWISS